MLVLSVDHLYDNIFINPFYTSITHPKLGCSESITIILILFNFLFTNVQITLGQSPHNSIKQTSIYPNKKTKAINLTYFLKDFKKKKNQKDLYLFFKKEDRIKFWIFKSRCKLWNNWKQIILASIICGWLTHKK